MKIVIIEDEELAARRLETMILESDPKIEILARLESIEEAVAWFQSHPEPDLIFLDIHLEDGVSFSIFEQVSIETPIIFTTAFDEYAIKAFKLKSIDYLLKPIIQEDLNSAIKKYRNWSQRERKVVDVQSLFELISTQKPFKTRFSVTIGQKIRLIPIEDIAYFYSDEGITFMVCKSNMEYPVDFSLEKLEEELDPDQFFRISRQFLVGLPSINHVHIYPKSKLKLELVPHSQKEVFVSIDRVTAFKRWLNT